MRGSRVGMAAMAAMATLALVVGFARPAAAVSLVLSEDAPECLRHTNEYDGGRVLITWVSAARLDPAIASGQKERQDTTSSLKRISEKLRDDVPDAPEDTRVGLWRVLSDTKRTKVAGFSGPDGREDIESMLKGKYELCFETSGVEHDIYDHMVTVDVVWSNPYQQPVQGPDDESHVDEGKRAMQMEDAKHLKRALEDVSDEILRLRADAKYLLARQKRQLKTIESNGRRAVWSNVWETLVLIAAAFGQAFFIRFMFNRANGGSFAMGKGLSV